MKIKGSTLVKEDVLTQDKIDNDLSFKWIFQDLEIKDKGNDRGIIKGYGSTYDLDLGGDRVIPGAFQEYLPLFMKNAVMLYCHWMDDLLGQWTKAQEDSNGLYLEGEINLKTQLGREKYALAQDKDLKGLSIGYEIKEAETDEVTGVYNLLKIRLWEVSLVAIPMNQHAWITDTKIYHPGFGETKKVKTANEVKLLHKDGDLKFNEVAMDMMKLLGARGKVDASSDKKKAVLNDLLKHYDELEKPKPEIPHLARLTYAKGKDKNFGAYTLMEEFDKIDFNDVKFYSDEKFIFESYNLKTTFESAKNIITHWEKNERDLPPEIKAKIQEIKKSIDKVVGEPEEPKAKVDLTSLTKLVGGALEKINTRQDPQVKIKEMLEEILSKKLSQITGGKVK